MGQEGRVGKRELNAQKATLPQFSGGSDKPAVRGRERSDVVGILLSQLGQLGERKDGHGVDLLMARDEKRKNKRERKRKGEEGQGTKEEEEE